MMALTFDTLKTQIADFLNRDDLTSQIPTFILLAEAAINRDLRHWQMEARTSTTIDARYEDLPTDFLEFRRVTIEGKRQLDLLSQAKMLELREINNNTGGRPQYYSVTGGQIEVYPSPDASYDAEFLYFQRIPELSDSQTTNWLLTDSPDVYLYGALMHSAPYLQEDPRLAVWVGLYNGAMQRLNESSSSGLYGGSGLTMR